LLDLLKQATMNERLNFLSNFITEEIFVIKSEATGGKSVSEPEQLPKEEKAPSDPVEPVKAAEEAPVYLKPLPTEGENLKHCLIFFESEESKLDDSKKAFLLKVMGSVKRSLNDVLLVNVKDASAEQIEAVFSEFNHRHVLAFGTQKIDKYAGSETYLVTEDKKKFYLKADDLLNIENTVELKKSLWGCLQKMFL